MLVGMGLNRQVEVPSPGVYIVEFKKGTVKVAIRYFYDLCKPKLIK